MTAKTHHGIGQAASQYSMYCLFFAEEPLKATLLLLALRKANTPRLPYGKLEGIIKAKKGEQGHARGGLVAG